jgi:prepilin-type N-terminal cleavage/methylation domain-containing protein
MNNKINITSFSKGFTLIELLVVIAIIGILSAIVTASLNSARNKGATAAVYATFHQIANQAALYRASSSDFGKSVSSCGSGVFSDSIIQSAEVNILANAASTATLSCYTDSNGNKWTISVSPLKTTTPTSWCIDNSGNLGAKTANSDGTCH